MHGTVPAHFSSEVRSHLDVTYPGRLLGRAEHVVWLPHSPDHKPAGFSICDHLKSVGHVGHETPVDTIEARIVVPAAYINATMLQSVSLSPSGSLFKTL